MKVNAVRPLPVRPIARPLAREATPAVPVKATAPAGVKADSSPQAFRAAIAASTAALQESVEGAKAAALALADAQTDLARAQTGNDGALKAADAALTTARTQHQPKVDAARQALQAAWADLDAAVHPGAPQADAKDAEAAKVRDQLRGIDDDIAGCYDSIARLSPHSWSYGQDAQGLNARIRELEGQKPALFQRYTTLSDEADASRKPQRATSDPAVKAAHQRVAAAETALLQAQVAYREATEPLLDGLDSAQQAFNLRMGPFRGAIVQAQHKVEVANARQGEAIAAYKAQEPHFGFFKRTWWKLIHKLDAHAAWQAGFVKATGRQP
ncbi:MAG: hypothetical protein JWM80_3334 [Cyanobacteria bacterium RYN_339]|nr:hypothetical protein [Cyanobacteria bacterium RYN_339]